MKNLALCVPVLRRNKSLQGLQPTSFAKSGTLYVNTVKMLQQVLDVSLQLVHVAYFCTSIMKPVCSKWKTYMHQKCSDITSDNRVRSFLFTLEGFTRYKCTFQHFGSLLRIQLRFHTFAIWEQLNGKRESPEALCVNSIILKSVFHESTGATLREIWKHFLNIYRHRNVSTF